MMNHLKAWRLGAELTQERAARLLGLSRLRLAYIEGGEVLPKAAEAERLRAAFGPTAERMLDPVLLPAGCIAASRAASL